MNKWLRQRCAAVAAMVLVCGGCQTVPQQTAELRDETKVKVDAEWHANEASPELIARVRQQKAAEQTGVYEFPPRADEKRPAPVESPREQQFAQAVVEHRPDPGPARPATAGLHQSRPPRKLATIPPMGYPTRLASAEEPAEPIVEPQADEPQEPAGQQEPPPAKPRAVPLAGATSGPLALFQTKPAPATEAAPPVKAEPAVPTEPETAQPSDETPEADDSDGDRRPEPRTLGGLLALRGIVEDAAGEGRAIIAVDGKGTVCVGAGETLAVEFAAEHVVLRVYRLTNKTVHLVRDDSEQLAEYERLSQVRNHLQRQLAQVAPARHFPAGNPRGGPQAAHYRSVQEQAGYLSQRYASLTRELRNVERQLETFTIPEEIILR